MEVGWYLVEDYETRSLRGINLLGASPRHHDVNVTSEMASGQFREQIAQIRIGFDTVHFAGADQAGEACPVSTALVMTGEEYAPSLPH